MVTSRFFLIFGVLKHNPLEFFMKKIKSMMMALALGGALFTTGCSGPDCGAASSAASTDATSAVIDNIMTRTSVRRFTSQPVGADTLESIVRAGMAAPTAKNLRPWAFVVVTEREVLDSLEAVHPYSNLATATAAIVVCGDMNKASEGFAREYWVQDCSAATENILLAAHAYGLGAVWCGVYPNRDVMPGVSRVLGLPSSVIPLNIITMGHPQGEQQPKDKWDAANLHYQRW